MLNKDEKIKAFLSDEGKVKQLASDEEFIGKVSGGVANAETYSEEFKKLGLNLSEDEVDQACQTTTDLLNVPVEKLADISLEKIAGGRLTPEEEAEMKKALDELLSTGVTDDLTDKVDDALVTASGFKKASKSMARRSPHPGFIALTAAGAVGALGCSVAATVCKALSAKAARLGDMSRSETYQKAAIGLGICVTPFAGMGVVGAIGLAKR